MVNTIKLTPEEIAFLIPLFLKREQGKIAAEAIESFAVMRAQREGQGVAARISIAEGTITTVTADELDAGTEQPRVIQ